MPKDDTEDAIIRSALKVAGTVGGAVAGATLAGPDGAVAGAAAGAMVESSFETALEALGGKIAALRDRRLRKWFDRAIRTKAGKQLQDAIREEQPDERLVATILESINAVDQCIAESAIPVLADLFAQYQGPPPAPDWYFRGMNRILRDVSEDEFAALKSLIEALAKTSEWPLVSVVEDTPGTDPNLSVPTVKYLKRGDKPEGEWVRIQPFPHATRIFHLLKTNGIATDGRTGAFGASSGPHRMDISRDVLDRVAELLSPST